MRTIGKIIGPILWIGASLLMFAFWFSAMSHWFGFLGGAILSFVLSPGLLIFPIIFWIVEGVFPTLYFLVWGIGIAGLIIGSISSSKDSSLEETANPNITDAEQAEFDELFEDKEVEPIEEETEEVLMEAIEEDVVDTDELSRQVMPNNSFLSDWQTVISPNKEFKVKLPRDWEEYTNEKETKKETGILSYTGFENNKTQAYLVQRNDYSALFLRSNIRVVESSMEKKLLQVRMDGFAETIGGENTQCQYDIFKDITALRFSTEGRTKKLTMRGLIFMRGALIYSLIGYSKKLDENKLRDFFDSFQFLPEVES